MLHINQEFKDSLKEPPILACLYEAKLLQMENLRYNSRRHN